MQEVFARVAKWNAARYEQEYNDALVLKLLREEYTEWKEAETVVDQVHELCDVIYVAFGAMWKLKGELTPETHSKSTDVILSFIDKFNIPATLISSSLDVLEVLPKGATIEAKLITLLTVTIYAQAQLLDYGLTQEKITQCMLVLCDSNDSKSVRKTASDVKANDNNKGTFYRSPVPGITQVLSGVE